MTTNDHEAGKVSEPSLCPHCEADALATKTHRLGGNVFWIVICRECQASTRRFDTRDEAIAAWNRRAESQTGAARVKALSVSDAVTQLTNAVEAEKQRNAIRDEMLATVIVNLEKSEMTAEFANLLRDYVRAERSKLSALEPTPIKATASPAVPADVQDISVDHHALRVAHLTPADYQRLADENERLRKERDVALDLNKRSRKHMAWEKEFVRAEAAEGKLSAIVAEASFLLDRLDDFERGGFADDIENAVCEFEGHVSPAFQRLRASLTSPPTEQGET